MTSGKKERYAKDDVRLAKYAKALAHPVRIAILRRIASMDESCFGEISQELPVADSTVSQHLSELKNAGLIQSKYEPPKVKYRISTGEWEKARKLLKEFMKIQSLALLK
jgi:ArsR family transcriptional regulator, arsenate/arsenite/antimonite-responsive transcriptional repressor